MPINKFQIRDLGPVRYASADSLPPVVIIAGPNGVGKSTLLEALKKRGGSLTVEGTGKCLYLSPHRTPAAFSFHKSIPFVGPRRRVIDVLALNAFSFNAPGISLPVELRSGRERS